MRVGRAEAATSAGAIDVGNETWSGMVGMP
jgi:hypothetical protein